MSDYTFPYKDAEFLLEEIVDFDGLCDEGGLDEVNSELATAVLEEANRLATEVIAPLNWIGNEKGATLGENGVQETPGFKEAYWQMVESGWCSLGFPEDWGGQGMPQVLATATDEIWQSANLGFSLCTMLTHGAVEALLAHGTDEQRQAYLEKLVSGEWTGTMCLTEPQAGSDLAAVATRALPEGDHFRLSGQKIYITWGDHQMTENVIHLVLARLPDAPQGVKGISLFLVPKFLLDENGEPGEPNDVKCISLEHKLGIHGSPTCTMALGEDDGAVGYLVGEPHNGLAAMFTMMNDARQRVGLQGLAASERSYQQALAYAKDRLQGTRKDGSRYPIINFPDVRRMLLLMKSGIEAMRALSYTAAAEIDRCRFAQDPGAKARHSARVDLYTPIVKGWLTEMSIELTSHGVQVHGGMGYVEETGSAQHFRDARITTIYEGTTGIQANDLVGRKTLADGGEAVGALIAEIRETADALSSIDDFSDLGSTLSEAAGWAHSACDWIVENAPRERQAAGSASVNYLMLMGYVCGGWLMGRAALKARARLESGSGDKAFLEAKRVTARFYYAHLLPRAAACLAAIQAGSEPIMSLTEDQF
ncbi:MAG: acyl-CoA dehydrogenase C-terminal domain-containing protein [Gammaproteobacteria bacterium]|nr:acyl-CoA dehydrogenase C-terminal domain-containing protein [Gammaproteobacteria bacterium]